jgi:DNA-binding MarR family transcriptional regulator
MTQPTRGKRDHSSLSNRNEWVDAQISPGQDRSINFRVHTLASSLFKGAMQYYVAHYGVGLPDMRILSNLSREGPLAAHQIVALTAMDKALVSRVLTMLNRRDYISSSSPKSDPRRRTWVLTRSGRDLVKRLQPEWRRRERIIQAGLSEAERSLLADLLDRLFAASEKLRAEEAAAVRGQRKAPTRTRTRMRVREFAE